MYPHAFEPQTITTREGAGKPKARCGEDRLLPGHKVLKPLHPSIADSTGLRAYPERQSQEKKRKMSSSQGAEHLNLRRVTRGKSQTRELLRRRSRVRANCAATGIAEFLHPSRGCQRRATKKGDLCDPNPAAVRKSECAAALRT